MLRRVFIPFLLALPGLACARNRTSPGDFAPFLVGEIHGRGGKTLPVDPLPSITGRWTIERDGFGFQIRLFDASFDAVDAFMTRIFGGHPLISEEKNLEGHRHKVFYRKFTGMHVQLIGKKSEIFIVAVGGKNGKQNTR